MIHLPSIAPRGSKALLLALLAPLALGGCGGLQTQSHGEYAAAGPKLPDCLQPLPDLAADPHSYRIAIGDELDVSFYLSPEFDQDVTVRPDGKVAMRLVGDLQAKGDTPMELAKEIDQAYAIELRDPQAAIRIKNMPGRQVYVEGMVAKPGAFPLLSGMTAAQAVAEAGGLTDEAGAERTVLIRRDGCGTVHTSEFDLDRALKNNNSQQDVTLMPADVVVVPRSGIANVNLFVTQWIKNNIPIEPYIPLF